MNATLKRCRSLLSQNNGSEAITYLDRYLRKGNRAPYHYVAKLMRKFALVANNADAPPPPRRIVQVLVLDVAHHEILLQKRGGYKRLFSHTWCMSANGKNNGEDPLETAEASIQEEIGITAVPSRLAVVGQPWNNHNHLTSVNFFAFSGAEEGALTNTYKATHPCNGVVLEWSSETRCLMVYTVDRNCARAVCSLAREIEGSTGVPGIFRFSNSDTNTLVSYQLTMQEESSLRTRLQHQSVLEDASRLAFFDWISIRTQARLNPQAFNQPVTQSYFLSDEMWSEMGYHEPPPIVSIEDPVAAFPAIAGGKGANLHTLRKISEDQPSLSFTVPRTEVVTTITFRHCVSADVNLAAEIRRLDDMSCPDTAEAGGTITRAERSLAARIREGIKTITFDDVLHAALADTFSRLAGSVAVRSSADCEDSAEHQAAGLADSFMDIDSVESLIQAVKHTWASLFSDAFVLYRRRAGVRTAETAMAVVIQDYVSADAGGVIFSTDQITRRPAYLISAQKHSCRGVVEGTGLVDSWLVGIVCDRILERSVVHNSGLDDATVLQIAVTARGIHRSFRKRGLADHIDIEFVTRRNQTFIVQCRPAPMEDRTDGEATTITTVDEARVPSSIETVRLSTESTTAVSGAVTAPLLIDASRNPSACKPGHILVTHHTSNDYASVLGAMAGIITTDGSQASHAAQNAFLWGIPCVVGSVGAIERLRPFDGQMVTFDAVHQKVYSGMVPSITERQFLDIWHEDEDYETIERFQDFGSRHEIHRPWHISKALRPRVFIEDPEGHFRLRSAGYRYFQLDAMWKGWDRQAETLNTLFGHRSAWTLTPQKREIKIAGDNRHHLVQQVEVNDPYSVFEFLSSLKDFGLDDMQELFDRRLGAFSSFRRYVGSIDQIDSQNASVITSRLVELFSWMHFGFWLDTVIEAEAAAHMRYVKNNEGSLHQVFRQIAAADLPDGTILHLTEEREIEIRAVVDSITASPELHDLFTAGEHPLTAPEIRAILDTRFPALLETIASWSIRYKLTREDIDVFDDSDEYIDEIRDRLSQQHGRLPDRNVIDPHLAREVKRVLDRYPKMKHTLQLSAAQFPLREDAHHLVMEPFRTLGRMMLKSAQPFVGTVFASPEEVFDLALDEFAALFEERDPTFLGSTPNRWHELRAAEIRLKDRWSIPTDSRLGRALIPRYIDSSGFVQDSVFEATTPEELVLPDWAEVHRAEIHALLVNTIAELPDHIAEYRTAVDEAIGVLDQQIRAATQHTVITYYQQEKERLQSRISKLEANYGH
jgi:phosphohistidine swiveling domain-containing protein